MNAEITINIINSQDFGYTEGFGYEIIINKEPFISQPHMPAIGFNRVFKSETDAQKVAELIVTKIRNGIIPPSEVYITGWGQEIFMDNWLYLQRFLVRGDNQAFKTEQDALEVANFIVFYTKRGNPIQELTEVQLDSLGINY